MQSRNGNFHYHLSVVWFMVLFSLEAMVAHVYGIEQPCRDEFAFPVHKGFPVQITGILRNSVVVADVDGDGQQELCFSLWSQGRTFLLRSNGQNYNSSWPRDNGAWTPALVNIDDDKELEIVLVSSRILICNLDGTVVPNWPHELPGGAMDTMCVMDLNGDKQLEVVVGFGYSVDYLTILDSEGSDLRGYPVTMEDTLYNHPGIADLDSDGVYEVIVGFHGWSHKKVIAYDLGGNVFQGNWIVNLEDLGLGGLRSDITIADIDGDNRPEILFGSDESDTAPYDTHAVVLNHDMSFASGWPKVVPRHIYGGFSVGDIDGDQKLEVSGVTAGYYDEARDLYLSRLYVWNGEDGSDLAGWPQDIVNLSCNGQNVVIGDIDGDCIPELVLACHDNALYLTQVIAYRFDGTILDGFPLTIDDYLIYWSNSCFIADIDNDGLVEIGVGVNDDVSQSRIYVWDLPYKYRKNCQDWPQYRHDAQHTGNYHFPEGLPILPQVPTLSPLSLLLLLVLLGCGILLSIEKTSSGECRNDHTNQN